MLRLLLFVLPLGLDTLGVSINLGIKSQPHDKSGVYRSFDQLPPRQLGCGFIQHVSTNCPPGSWGNAFPPWLVSALLFSIAETVMPVVGLAIGFSLGAITSGTLSGGQVIPGSKTVSTITLCILIGLQGFLMTLIGLTLGRTLRVRLKSAKEWTEFLSCFLLIALGIWLLVT